jgi:hypothetical protein
VRVFYLDPEFTRVGRKPVGAIVGIFERSGEAVPLCLPQDVGLCTVVERDLFRLETVVDADTRMLSTRPPGFRE